GLLEGVTRAHRPKQRFTGIHHRGRLHPESLFRRTAKPAGSPIAETSSQRTLCKASSAVYRWRGGTTGTAARRANAQSTRASAQAAATRLVATRRPGHGNRARQARRRKFGHHELAFADDG